jgi:hypothetical protein
MIDNSNKCKNCSVDIPNGRKFCDRSCAATYNNKLYPKRVYGRTKPKCLNCGKEIEDDRYDRKYCNSQCHGAKKRKDLYEKVSNEDFENLGNKASIDRTSKQYLIHLHGEKCMICGWDIKNKWTNKVPIELNHIDGNPENHSLTNLELICPNCHSLTEFNKRRGKGRKWRKTIFTQ